MILAQSKRLFGLKSKTRTNSFHIQIKGVLINIKPQAYFFKPITILPITLNSN